MSRLGRVRAGAGVLFLATCFLMDGCAVDGLAPRDVVLVVLSQNGSHHEAQARQLRSDLHQQARPFDKDPPKIHLAHEEFVHPGAWTVLPILSRLNSLHGANSSWIFFCECQTKVNLLHLLNLLSHYDSTKEMWVGHALYDREASIIHHFAFFNDPQHFKYPNFASGFAISRPLLQRLVSRLTQEDISQTDFSIDPSHELAMFVWDNGHGPKLEHSPLLCLTDQPLCASFPQPFQPCGNPVVRDSIYFAVKTCGKFHKDRIPVVKKTWAKYAVQIGFYSEVQDDDIPTIDLGIPNTEHGHCGKTFAILKHAAKVAETSVDIKWVVIADDDTILSVARLQQFLSCFDPSESVAVGERYGYNVQRSNLGYNYITGGGGMVFSISLVSKMVHSNYCKCPSNTTPDDMFVGICLARLGVSVTHSALFHQARPLDYAPEYLTTQLPVSFHKHWMIDPVNVYLKWFADVDQQFELANTAQKHVEL